MKTRKRRIRKKMISALLFCAALTCLCTNYSVIFSLIASAAESTAQFSAMVVMPEGGAGYIQRQIDKNEATTVSTITSELENNEDDTGKNISTTQKATTSTTSKEPEKSTAAGTGKVITTNLSTSGYSFKLNSLYVKNQTKTHTFDIAKELAKRPDINIIKNAKPQVLIFHTHATESFLQNDTGEYNKNYSARTTDNTKNVTRVGEEIKKQLDAAGIVTIQDKTQHDYPSYNGAYERSAKTIKYYLKKYPSIDVVLDIHRDAITRDDGTKVKPTATIAGKKAAQIMICAGCQDGPVTGFPDWEYNLRFALRIQKQCAESYQGLARPMLFLSKQYNESLSRGSLLIEIGSDSNTLDEAIYSGQLLGKSLANVLNGLTKK